MWSALALSPLQAQQVVEFTSEPPGALVVVDHLVRGNTPLTLDDLQPGEHLIRISGGSEYRPYTQKVVIEENHSESCHVVLTPITATSLKEGIALIGSGQTEEAEQAFGRALRESPIQPEAYWWLARIAFQRNDDVQAKRMLKSYAQYFPQQPRVHLMLGDIHQRAGDLASAYTSYKLALLTTESLKHALDEPVKVTWEAIKEAGEPTEAQAQMRLAYLYEMKGRVPQALDWIERAVNITFADRALRLVR